MQPECIMHSWEGSYYEQRRGNAIYSVFYIIHMLLFMLNWVITIVQQVKNVNSRMMPIFTGGVTFQYSITFESERTHRISSESNR